MGSDKNTKNVWRSWSCIIPNCTLIFEDVSLGHTAACTKETKLKLLALHGISMTIGSTNSGKEVYNVSRMDPLKKCTRNFTAISGINVSTMQSYIFPFCCTARSVLQKSVTEASCKIMNHLHKLASSTHRDNGTEEEE